MKLITSLIILSSCKFIVKAAVDSLPEKAVVDLFFAVRAGNRSGVEPFLPMIKGSALEDSALNLAVTLKQTDLVHFMLDNDANPNALDIRDEGKCPLHHAAENANLALIHLLVRYGANVDCQSKGSNMTPLIAAVMVNSVDTVRLLIDYRADVNKTDKNSNSALHYAIGLGNYEIIRILLNRQAYVNPKRDLYYAASVANISQQIIISLLNKGADINSADKIGRTPLYYAVRYKNASLVRLLLQRGANPNQDMSGCNSPLHIAVTTMAGVEICRILLDYGAKFHNVDCTGLTPLQIAQETRSKQPDVADLLYEAAVGEYEPSMAPLINAVPLSPTATCGCYANRYVISTPDIRVDKLQGFFRFEYIKDDPDLNLLGLHFNINKPLKGVRSGDFNFLLRPTTSEGISTVSVFRFTSLFPLKSGDKISYWLLAILDGRGYAQLTDQTWTFHGDDENNDSLYHVKNIF